MSVDKKILEELSRYRSINRYINEQELPAPPPPAGEETPAALPPAGEETPAPAAGATPSGPEPVDVENDPDVEKIDDKGESTDKKEGEGDDTEELDITELVDSQKQISQKQDDYFEELFAHIERLESKLGEMDNLVNKINSLEATIEKTRPKTPQEKLELRSLDSGPYNQKLTDFFVDKEQDLQKSGKNEYVLTTDEVENFSPSDIRGSFNLVPNKNFGI
jgi:hypothetical protein